MKREITKIIIHCSDTREGQEITAADIDWWHRERGWSGIGYHYVVKLDGVIEYGRPVSKIGAHVKGHNSKSIGICYIGGKDKDFKEIKDTRTEEQKFILYHLLITLKRLHPKAVIHGHRDFSTKECPSFDATKEYEKI